MIYKHSLLNEIFFNKFKEEWIVKYTPCMALFFFLWRIPWGVMMKENAELLALPCSTPKVVRGDPPKFIVTLLLSYYQTLSFPYFPSIPFSPFQSISVNFSLQFFSNICCIFTNIYSKYSQEWHASLALGFSNSDFCVLLDRKISLWEIFIQPFPCGG